MKYRKLFVILALLLCAAVAVAQEPICDHFVYLPVVVAPSTPTSTPTPRLVVTVTTPTMTP